MTDERQIEVYLKTLRTRLSPLPAAEREEIVREIGAHIDESVRSLGLPLDRVLRRLGGPAELATQYRDSALLERASRSYSPVVLLRAAVRLAAGGMLGVLVFVCGLFGYAFGVGLLLTGLLKPLLPDRTGVWMVGGEVVQSGVQLYPPQPPAHEVMGWWYVPVALVLGSLLVVLTTLAVRVFVGTSRRVRLKLA